MRSHDLLVHFGDNKKLNQIVGDYKFTSIKALLKISQKLNKDKLLIVGAFPSNNKKIYGGILKSCKLILDSSIADTFNLLKIDSSQKSNPPL